jgi:hypothetical protein
MAGGTSMSSPAVSGIVAMLLQIDSTLTPAEIKNLLFTTAITDSKTGVIPAGGSTVWGHGKVNAYDAVASLLGVLSVKNNNSILSCKVFPNPSNGEFQIEMLSSINDLLTIHVTDFTGRDVHQKVIPISQGFNYIPFNLNQNSNGLYLIKLQSAHGIQTIKVLKEPN